MRRWEHSITLVEVPTLRYVWCRLVPVGLADGEPVVHVLAVRARVGELFVALAALERLLARVQPLVLGQVVLVLERLRTLHALVRTLTYTGINTRYYISTENRQ